MTITYQREGWRDAYPEMFPILVQHWHEIALGHAKVPLDIAVERYQAMCDAGTLHLVTARADGLLIGYHVAIIGGHLHYQSTLHGITDVYFIVPEHRKGFVGIRLFRHVEQDMKAMGVKKLITGAKLHTADGRSGLLFKHLGFNETETVFTKLIGD